MREEKRSLLLETAAQVFSQQGYASTRVGDIAERAGVAKGTVYEYFTSKEDLFFSVFGWFTETIKARIDELLAGCPSPRDKLFALCRFGGELTVEQRDMFPMMNIDLWVNIRHKGSSEYSQEFNRQYDSFRELVAGIIREGQRCGEFRQEAEPDAVAILLVSTFDGLGMQYWLNDAIDPVRASEQFVLTLCRGLCQEDQ
jgi:AcrR family transcriptional regulator